MKARQHESFSGLAGLAYRSAVQQGAKLRSREIVKLFSDISEWTNGRIMRTKRVRAASLDLAVGRYER